MPRTLPVPVAIEDDSINVGLQIDGSVMVYDRAANTFDTIPASVVRRIVALAGIKGAAA